MLKWVIITLMLHLSALNHNFSVIEMLSINTAITNQIGDNAISQLPLYSQIAELAMIATTIGMFISQFPAVVCANIVSDLKFQLNIQV